MSLTQPLGQKILTNISVVRFEKKGFHFEIAVVPNKVTSWRQGLETDINEVLQSHSIFTNVDQGMLAPASSIQSAFGDISNDEVVKIILEKGKVSLAEKERKLLIENLTKDIASLVASQCVNSNTQRPLTPTMVLRAMKAIGYSVKLKKNAKAQALAVIKLLQAENYPITRARIRMKLYAAPEIIDQMIKLLPIVESIEKPPEDSSSSMSQKGSVIAQVDPGQLRPLAQKLAETFGGDINIDILELYVSSPPPSHQDESVM